MTFKQLERAFRSGEACIGGERLSAGDMVRCASDTGGKLAGYYVGKSVLHPVGLHTGDGAAVIREWEKRLEDAADAP